MANEKMPVAKSPVWVDGKAFLDNLACVGHMGEDNLSSLKALSGVADPNYDFI
ncbi:MAG: hypothetical protein AAFX51_19235 [Cyanobacteria bacterium J06636_28]